MMRCFGGFGERRGSTAPPRHVSSLYLNSDSMLRFLLLEIMPRLLQLGFYSLQLPLARLKIRLVPFRCCLRFLQGLAVT